MHLTASVEHRGATWSFEPVVFDPKPVQPSGPPIHVGGEGLAALRRVVRVGDGWIAMEHTPETLRPRVEKLRGMLEEAGRDPATVEITASGVISSPDDVVAWEEAGVDRLITTPWTSGRTAVEEMTAFAVELGLS